MENHVTRALNGFRELQALEKRDVEKKMRLSIPSDPKIFDQLEAHSSTEGLGRVEVRRNEVQVR